MERLLRTGVMFLAVWSIAVLAAQLRWAARFGRRHAFARPAGRTARAVAYAFGPGMLPQAKESVREHRLAYLAGVGYHLGIFASLMLLALWVAGHAPGGAPGHAFRAATLCGALCGVGLLVRRAVTPSVRRLSGVDDVLANALTTTFVALALGTTLWAKAEPWWMGASMVLLLYVPLGKLRHCVFFFVTRWHAAVFFGRRGVLPPPA